MGTLIRHASVRPSTAILPLPVAMVQSSFRTALVTVVSPASLLEPCDGAAGRAAIALSAITVLADEEDRAASAAAANPLPKNDFAVNGHARPWAGLDNGNRSWQVRTSFDAWPPAKGCQAGTWTVARPGSSLVPPCHIDLTPSMTYLMIDG